MCDAYMIHGSSLEVCQQWYLKLREGTEEMMWQPCWSYRRGVTIYINRMWELMRSSVYYSLGYKCGSGVTRLWEHTEGMSAVSPLWHVSKYQYMMRQVLLIALMCKSPARAHGARPHSEGKNQSSLFPRHINIMLFCLKSYIWHIKSPR